MSEHQDGARAAPGPADGRGTGRLGEVARLFLKLGTIGFGGPAAHIALMHDEVVTRRRWLDEQRFLDLIGATNLIPGPNSTELAIHLGYARARWRGLVTAGVCFILPAFAIVLALAWSYVRYGRTPAADGLLYGIKPVVVAIIAWALLKLVPTAVRGVLTGLIGAAAVACYLLGVNELLILAAGAAALLLARVGPVWLRRAPLPLLLPLLVAAQGGLGDASAGRLWRLLLIFLKIGSVLYGSGYVLLAFLHGDFVDRLGWLTQGQLLDAIAIGQVTPGPVFTTATFVGYVVAGMPGAILATIGIFLPSFVLVGLLARLVRHVRDHLWSAALLDGVNAAALGLMAGVTWQLGRTALVDPLTGVLFAGGLLALWRLRLNSAWLIAAGAAVGLARTLLG
ncbi:MAG TPA: chromate efflux transporter [Actinomycetes bacterium]|nr:chromate efflux transporter [Actinomycetes bacterium]